MRNKSNQLELISSKNRRGLSQEVFSAKPEIVVGIPAPGLESGERPPSSCSFFRVVAPGMCT